MTTSSSPALRRRALLLSAALALAFPALAQAQAGYPTKSVTFIVPFAPGGGTEVGAAGAAHGFSCGCGSAGGGGWAGGGWSAGGPAGCSPAAGGASA